MTDRSPSELLLEVRRSIDHVSRVNLIEDLTWNSELDVWTLTLEVQLNQNSNTFPEKTMWVAVFKNKIEPGHCEFYPHSVGGITSTFPHQTVNLQESKERPWRSGNPCIDDPLYTLGRRNFIPEPLEPSERFLWRLQRLVDWVDAASTGCLTNDGDPFELPSLNSSKISLSFLENSESFDLWNSHECCYGFVQLATLKGNSDVLVPLVYEDKHGTAIYTCCWGSIKEQLQPERQKALWLRISSIPVKRPWDSRITWKDLIDMCMADGLNFKNMLASWLEVLRTANRHRLLLGFPIPEIIDGPPVQIQWQLANLPGFQSTTPNGFRNNPTTLLDFYTKYLLHEDNEVQWAASENWSSKEMTTRGRISKDLEDSKIAIVGLGAIGSYLAEYLVRAGVQKLMLIDPDDIEPGNMSRHTLTLQNIGDKKARALQERLRCISGQVEVEYASCSFSGLSDRQIEQMDSSRIVIDATGSDRVLEQFSRYKWKSSKRFFSCSLGLYGNQIYCLASYGDSFPAADFTERLRPYIEKDWEEIDAYCKNIATL